MPENNKYKKRIITIPNLLSLFRLCLVPVIVWLYCVKQDSLWTTLTLALSGITDIADGIIARRFGMVSDFGKAFDPVADKLTQITVLFCLASRYPYMTVAFGVLVVKELFCGITGLLSIQKTGTVEGADWHGKTATVLLYAVMLIHLVWSRIPAPVSYALVGLCVAVILLSGVLYGIRNIRSLRK